MLASTTCPRRLLASPRMTSRNPHASRMALGSPWTHIHTKRATSLRSCLSVFSFARTHGETRRNGAFRACLGSRSSQMIVRGFAFNLLTSVCPPTVALASVLGSTRHRPAQLSSTALIAVQRASDEHRPVSQPSHTLWSGGHPCSISNAFANAHRSCLTAHKTCTTSANVR
ncbi:hypothetical protein BD413DRAFT_261822 [Trametes elegans]|nr:hypothetical protein BD413DRAFT_261822 [Trametes elegans]